MSVTYNCFELKIHLIFQLKIRLFSKFKYFTVSDRLLADIEEQKKRIPLDIDTNMMKIGFLGGGKMAQALASGFLNAGKHFFYDSSN